MNFPKDLMYSKDHEWLKSASDGTALIGITDFAQNQLGDLVFVNLPQVGDALTMDEPLGDVESVKAVSDVLSPVSAVVKAINEELLDNPAKINQAPYEAWFVKVESIKEHTNLMDAQAYEKHCAEQEK